MHTRTSVTQQPFVANRLVSKVANYYNVRTTQQRITLNATFYYVFVVNGYVLIPPIPYTQFSKRQWRQRLAQQ